MTKERKQYLDGLWMNTDVGKWAIFLAEEKHKEAENVLEDIFKRGYYDSYNYLMEIEKESCQKIKNALSNIKEGKEYIQMLEKENYDLVGVMVAHEFSMLELFY